MSKATIHIAFDGPEVEAGTMDARALAPALLGISNLLEDANRTLNGSDAKARVLIRSDFRPGSFEVVLELVQTIAETTKILIGITKDFSANEVAGLVGLSAGSGVTLIKLIKWLRGRKVKMATVIDNGKIRIETEGEYDNIEVSKEVVKLYRDKKVRSSFQGIVEPLSREGIKRFIVRDDRKEIETIQQDEKDYFDIPATVEEEIVTSTRHSAFNVIGVFFEEKLKWKLFDGESRINAAILDREFLEEMDKGRVSFTKGDILEVELRTRQWKTDSGLKTEHEVIKVIKQHKASNQLPLPFNSAHNPDTET